jgi:hypothetical protein
MWVAACCLTHEVPLATLNFEDYEDFKEHHGLGILRSHPSGRPPYGHGVYRARLPAASRSGALAVWPFQAASGLRNVRSRKNGIDTHS